MGIFDLLANAAKELNTKSGKLKKQLKRGFGVKPDLYYFAGDMDGIRTYADYRRDNGLDEFLIDDTTWNDLSMDDVFKRINHGLSTSGEQYLYYLLRSPAIEQSEYEKREKLIALMENNPEMRLKIQVVLAKLGKRRAANTCEAFYPSVHSPKKLFLYLLLVFSLIGCGIAAFFVPDMRLLFFGLLFFIPMYHQSAVAKMEMDLATVAYSVGMIYAQRKIKKLSFAELDCRLSTLYEAGERLKSIMRVGIPPSSLASEISSIANSFFMIDLITYELLKNCLGRHHEDIFCIHEELGRIDAAIAVASYRETLECYSIPEIDFSSECAHFSGTSLVHPLIDEAVPNDLDTEQSVLLTGSNASGKSTFLKTVALNAVMAQSICTVLCESYSASAFRVYSSMAIADNLAAGESYYIAEIKSLKRIADTAALKKPILCVIDEVLRGTNTVERIAASSELLKSMTSGTMLCLAATHDIELCAILGNEYKMLHFEETVTRHGEIQFDYKLKDGAATTRNALKLLKNMGFDGEMVSRADERANKYMSDGIWT